MAEGALSGEESLRRRFREKEYLRPVDLARAAGLGVTQIRTYEEVGFLPPAERGANGYRRYTPEHVEALRVSRIVIAGYGWLNALDVLRAVHAGDTALVLALVNARHAALDSQHTRITAALEATEAVLMRTPAPRDRPFVRIQEAADTVGARASAVRFWERQGLLRPLREAGTGYRLYDVDELARLNVVALLRDVGYRFDTIREVLDELSGGNPDQVRSALEERLEALHRATWRCATATSAVRDYLEKLSLAPPGV